jgi:hypothetical protein
MDKKLESPTKEYKVELWTKKQKKYWQF